MVLLFHFHQVPAEFNGMFFHFPGSLFRIPGKHSFNSSCMQTGRVEFLCIGFNRLDNLLRDPHDGADQGFEETVPAHLGEDVMDRCFSVDLFR